MRRVPVDRHFPHGKPVSLVELLTFLENPLSSGLEQTYWKALPTIDISATIAAYFMNIFNILRSVFNSS